MDVNWTRYAHALVAVALLTLSTGSILFVDGAEGWQPQHMPSTAPSLVDSHLETSQWPGRRISSHLFQQSNRLNGRQNDYRSDENNDDWVWNAARGGSFTNVPRSSFRRNTSLRSTKQPPLPLKADDDNNSERTNGKPRQRSSQLLSTVPLQPPLWYRTGTTSFGALPPTTKNSFPHPRSTLSQKPRATSTFRIVRATNKKQTPNETPSLTPRIESILERQRLHRRDSSIAATEETSSTSILGRSKVDLALGATYFCSALSLTLPVILNPLIAAEFSSVAASVSPASAVTAATFITTMASISTLGGGLGKCINGFVCQRLGGRMSSGLYLAGMSVVLLILSQTPLASVSASMLPSARTFGVILAALEFFASIQWTACSLILANRYERNPTRLAAGMTLLGLASTSGTLMGKMGGTTLLHFVPSWRSVAMGGAVICLLGSLIVQTLISAEDEKPLIEEQSSTWQFFDIPPSGTSRITTPEESSDDEFSARSVTSSIQSVLGNPLFWQVGFAHATTFLPRTSDRVLGAFFEQMTGLSSALCGGLTIAVTLGFVLGLSKGSVFYNLPDAKSKSKLLRNSYVSAVASCVGLAICGSTWLSTALGPPHLLLAAIMAFLTFKMSSSVSFQFYQIPTMASNMFGKNKAVCLSFFDGLGFFLSAPIWAATGKIVGSLGENAWSIVWLMIGSLIGLGGMSMLSTLPHILHHQEEKSED